MRIDIPILIIVLVLLVFFFIIWIFASKIAIENKDFCIRQNGTTEGKLFDNDCYIEEDGIYTVYKIKEINDKKILVRE